MVFRELSFRHTCMKGETFQGRTFIQQQVESQRESLNQKHREHETTHDLFEKLLWKYVIC